MSKSNMMKGKKLVIIGAGPSGLLASLLLKKYFNEIILWEKKSAIVRKVCGEYLCPSGVQLIHSLGLQDTLEGFHRVEGMRLFSPKTTLFQSKEIKATFPNNQYGISVNRKIWQDRLLKKATEQGVQVNFDKTISSISYDKNNKLKITDQHQHEISEVDLLLGADGINSKVAQLLNIKVAPGNKRMVLHTLIKKNQQDRYGQMRIFSGGNYLGINPINENEINYSLVLNHDDLKHSSGPKDYLKALHEKHPELELCFPLNHMDEIHSLGRIYFMPEKIIGHCFALLGDASGFYDPLTGEGMYNALLSSWILTQSIKNSNSINEGLTDYEKNKKKILAEKSRLNRFFQLVIKSPLLCFLIAKIISAPHRASIFIGIIGNIYTPLQGFKKLLSERKK